MPKKSGKLALARRTATGLRRKMEDERLQAGGGAGLGGGVAALIDRDGIRRVGDGPVTVNLVAGGALMAGALFVKKLPFRALAAGAGMGMFAVGTYILTQEVQGNANLTLQPTGTE